MQKPPHLLSGNVFASSYIRNGGKCPAWEPHPVWAFANNDLGKPLCEDCMGELCGAKVMGEIEKATAPKSVIVYSSMEWNAPGKPLVFDIEALDECAETFHDDFIDELKHLKECIEQYINRRRSMTNVRRAEYELETLLKQNGHSDEMPF